MFSAGIYRAKIYEAGIYAGSGVPLPNNAFIPNLHRNIGRGMFRTDIKMGRGRMSRSGAKMSSGRMTKVR